MKKQNKLLILQIINIILFASHYLLYDVLYLLLGHPELFLKSYETVKPYETTLLYQATVQVEPYVQLLFFLIFIFSIFVTLKIRKMKIETSEKKWKFFYYFNIFIIIIYSLAVLRAILFIPYFHIFF